MSQSGPFNAQQAKIAIDRILNADQSAARIKQVYDNTVKQDQAAVLSHVTFRLLKLTGQISRQPGQHPIDAVFTVYSSRSNPPAKPGGRP